MRLLHGLIIAALVFSLYPSLGIMAQQRKHKCIREPSSSAGPIKEMDEIKQPKLIKQVPISFQQGKVFSPFIGRLVFELVINEKGKVECAEYIGKEVVDNEILEVAKTAILQFEYEVPRDAQGTAVAVYWVVVINIDPSR
mgnify:CR=1 FL=1